MNNLNKEQIEERKEYLRSTISVPDTLYRYGVQVIRNRSKGFCHDGKDMNMKVFETGCKCFVCNKSFDIFDITMHFNNCDFWTAFELLGGTERLSFTAVVKANKAKRERENQKASELNLKIKLMQIRDQITAYRDIIAEAEPLTDIWSYCQNKLQYQLYLLEYYNEKR